MTLVQTVSKLLNKEVSENEAKQFALEQFGTLATYLRTKPVNTIDGFVHELINGETVCIIDESERQQVQRKLRKIKKNATIVLSQMREF